MSLEQIKQFARSRNYESALELAVQMINTIKTTKSLSNVRKILLQLEDEQSFYLLIRVLDYGLMYQYSNFIARFAYKKHETLWILSWNIDDYLDRGKIGSFEKELKKRLDAGELLQYPNDVQAKILFTYAQVLMELKRWNEAEDILDKMQQNQDIPMADKWGYFYLEQGERRKAKESFLQGVQSTEVGSRCYLMVAQIEAMEGNHETSLAFIEEGIKHFGQVPDLLLERIRRYRDLQKLNEIYVQITNLSARLPDCFFNAYLAKLRADYYYGKQDFSSLKKHLDHEKCLVNLPYHHMKAEGNHKQIPLKPIVQKSNYCVPASLSMILQKHGEYKSQEEIAESIFNNVGSKLSTTVAYWEKIGYTCRYITADLDTLKKCVDLEIPILISINVGLFSHVQIVTGYDDRLDVVYIQDPNTLEGLNISYESYLETYHITNYLGIIGLPQAQSGVLSQFEYDDHLYYRRLFEFLELLETNEERHIYELEAFLKQHWNHDYTKLFIIKHLHEELVKNLFNQAVSELEEVMERSETSILHVANGCLNFDELERAKGYLQRVKEGKSNGFYHLLKGRIAYEEDDYEESIHQFNQSLKYDSEDAVTWSYLALSYLYDDKPTESLEASTIALEIQDDSFILFNHCKIMIANQLYNEALSFMNQHFNEENQDAYWMYLQAQIDHGLDKIDSAIEVLYKAIELQDDFGSAYLLLADLLDEEKSNVTLATTVLQDALKYVEDKQEIWIRLGQLCLDGKHYEQACNHFQSCIEEYPEYAFGYVKYADTLIEMGLVKEGLEFYLQHEQAFNEDIEFIMNAGIAFLTHHEEQKGFIQKGLQHLENGLPGLENNWEEPLQLYYKSLLDNNLVERGISFLDSLIAEKHELSYAFLAYKGMLLHGLGDRQGISLLQESFEINPCVFTAYQLGQAYLSIDQLGLAKEAFQYCLENNDGDKKELLDLIDLTIENTNQTRIDE